MASETIARSNWNSNEIIVNLKSNFKSQLAKCQSIIDETRNNSVVLKGMGRATSRAVNLAIQLNANNFNSFKITPSTYTVKIDNRLPPILGVKKDLFNPDEMQSVKCSLKYISAIQVVVQKSDLEIEKLSKNHKFLLREHN